MICTLQIDSMGESVEPEETARILRDMGCKYGQGYLFGKPMPLDELMSPPQVRAAPSLCGAMNTVSTPV